MTIILSDDNKAVDAGDAADIVISLRHRNRELEAENARLKDELTFAHHIIKNGAQTGEEAAYVFDIPQPPEGSMG